MHPRSSYRHWLALAVGIYAVTGLSPAFANSVGITGYSGKQGPICSTQSACHTSSAPKAPLVRFDGPTEVPVQALATFQFVVHSQAPVTQTHAGFNVAASAGVLTPRQCKTDPLNCEHHFAPNIDEITHSAPHPNDSNADVTFEFTWQAPPDPGTYILYGAGNSVNRNFLNTGDKPAATTFMVKVVAATASPSPTPTDTPPAPTDTPTQTPTDTPPQTPTNTPSPLPCIGDCSSNGVVTADELLIGVEIALGALPVESCTIFNANQDAVVSVSELLMAVNAGASDCSGQ